MKKCLYGVKIILKSVADNDPDEYVFMEELVVTVKVAGPNKAVKKAKKYVKGYCKPYQNGYGNMVHTEIYQILDPFEAFEPAKNGVREIYSKHTTFLDKVNGDDMILPLKYRDYDKELAIKMNREIIEKTNTLYTLTLYDIIDDYRQGFFIGVFISYDEAELIAKKYLNKITGFKDYPCEYEIIAKEVIGELDGSNSVSLICGWNENEYMDEVDIWESDLYTDHTVAKTVQRAMEKVIERKEWTTSRYKIGEMLWQNGFVRV